MHELPLRLSPGAFDLPHTSRLDDLLAWASDRRDWFSERLIEHAAVLFRGFDLDASAFGRFVEALDPRPYDYLAGISPRKKLAPGVYESTSYPPSWPLRLHCELAQTLSAPERLFFFGSKPASDGGETLLLDARALLARLDPTFRARVEAARVGYFWTYLPRTVPGSSIKSWPEAFQTEDRAEVSRALDEQGFEHGFRDSGMLWTYVVRDGVIDHPVSGERTWFNQIDLRSPPTAEEIIAWGKAVVAGPAASSVMRWCGFGDGTPFDADMIGHLRDVSASLTHAHRWESGDVIVLDNAACQHGRNPFSGEREILVAMTGAFTARRGGARA